MIPASKRPATQHRHPRAAQAPMDDVRGTPPARRGAAASSAAEATDQAVGSAKGIDTVPDLSLSPVHVDFAIMFGSPDLAVPRNVLELKEQFIFWAFGEAVVLMKMALRKMATWRARSLARRFWAQALLNGSMTMKTYGSGKKLNYQGGSPRSRCGLRMRSSRVRPISSSQATPRGPVLRCATGVAATFRCQEQIGGGANVAHTGAGPAAWTNAGYVSDRAGPWRPPAPRWTNKSGSSWT